MDENVFDLKLLEPAQDELENIVRLYLVMAGSESARRISEKIYESLERLFLFPISGTILRDPELRAYGYRSIVAEKYIIIYRLIGNTVFIYHIFDGRTDYPTLMKTQYFTDKNYEI